MTKAAPLRPPEIPGGGVDPAAVALIASGARGSSLPPAEPVMEPVRDSTGIAAIAERVPDRADDTKPLHLRIPKPLHKRLKILAMLTGVTMTEVVLDCLGPEVERRMAEYNRGG